MNIDTNPEQPPDPTIERSTHRRWTWRCTLIGNRENVVAGFSWDQKYTLSNELRDKNQGTVTQIIRAPERDMIRVAIPYGLITPFFHGARRG